MGLDLRNPVMIGSSGLTDSVEKVMELERAGAGAVVLKSLFEEQIHLFLRRKSLEGGMPAGYPEVAEFVEGMTREGALDDYLELVNRCRREVSVPVIASINCLSLSEWINFSKDVQDAGASALELNISMMPSDPQRSGEQNEAAYLGILTEVKRRVTIPLAAKISPYFTGLANSAMKFSWTGIEGLVLFNRYATADIDLETMSVVQGGLFSDPSEYTLPLRWTGILSSRVTCDIAASTGIHDGETAVKLLLAGARAVQVCSVIYQRGSSQIGRILGEMETVLDRAGYASAEECVGKMSMRSVENPAAYERVQFMKYMSEAE